MYKYKDGTFVIAHMAGTRDTPLKVEQFVKNTASQDGYSVHIGVEQEPGSAGVADAQNYIRLLAGFAVGVEKPTKDKLTRALPLSAQCEHGNVLILRGAWNDAFFTEVENFDGEGKSGHDDQVDVASGAFNKLCGKVSILDVL